MYILILLGDPPQPWTLYLLTYAFDNNTLNMFYKQCNYKKNINWHFFYPQHWLPLISDRELPTGVVPHRSFLLTWIMPDVY